MRKTQFPIVKLVRKLKVRSHSAPYPDNLSGYLNPDILKSGF